MTFLAWSMLFGLAGIAIPVILHLLSRRETRRVEWGAMIFLLGSIARRHRRILIEEIILLVLRCLLVALLALAMARPLVTPERAGLWFMLLPTALAGAAAIGAGGALWRHPRWRWSLLGGGAALLLVVGLMAGAGHRLGMRFRAAPGQKDLAIVIDASASMSLSAGGASNFDRALEEARAVVKALGRGDAAGMIFAGAAPDPLTKGPVAARREVLAALAKPYPTAGTMSAIDALSAAALMLGQGQNPLKQIVLLTDGQALGWDVRNDARWQFVSDLLWKTAPGAEQKGDRLPPVRVICRVLAPPRQWRNLAATDISLSRPVVGFDRPVRIDVRVENTGTTDMGPGQLRLTVDDADVQRATVSLLRPGQAETVSFSHLFRTNAAAGLQRFITASLEGSDDLAADNEANRLLRLTPSLPVLVVDGNPAPRALDRASAFILAALNPAPEDHAGAPPVPAAPAPAAPAPGTIIPTVVNAVDLNAATDCGKYRAVILANVPRLPTEVAAALSRRVEAGGGLLIAPGDRAEPEFYNQWRTPGGGRRVSGVRLVEQRGGGDEQSAGRPALTTLTHPALRMLSDENQSDLGDARIRSGWKLEIDKLESSAQAGGLLEGGDLLLVENRLGAGSVLTLAMALDPSSGNLPTRKSFVPLVHELTYYLGGRGAEDVLNLQQAVLLKVRLRTRQLGVERGLQGDYFAGGSFEKWILARVDPAIDLNWGVQSPGPAVPGDGFSIRWTGSLTPRVAGKHTFFLTADDAAGLWIDGKAVIPPGPSGTGKADLETGRGHDIAVEYREGAGGASVRLEWEPPGQPREVVPPDRLVAARSMRALAVQAAGAKLVAPDRTERPAELSAQDGTLVVSARDATVPGLYRLNVPALVATQFADLLDGAGTIPLAVSGAGAEGKLQALKTEDFAALRAHVDLVRPDSVEQLLAVLKGGVAGRELWRALALVALLLAVVEILFARWIGGQRRTGTARAVDFDSGGGAATGSVRQPRRAGRT